MLVEFDLSAVAPLGQYQRLLEAIHEWAEMQHVKYSIKRRELILRVCFDDERIYQWFALTWPHSWAKYRIVEHRSN